MQSPNPEPLRSFLDRVAAQLKFVLRQSVTPIGRYTGAGLVPHGTGTLFRVADASFLVTAGHVFNANADLCVFDLCEPEPGAQRLHEVPLGGHLHRVGDPPDVAVIELGDSVVERLRGRRFLRLNEVRLRPEPDWPCWVYGFPLEGSGYEPGTSRFWPAEFSLATQVYDQDVALENHDQHCHFLLDANRNSLYLPDGTPTDLPRDLQGISGASIWQAGRPGADSNPDDPRIVGVQMAYHRRPSVIKATHWGVVANIIHQKRPDLRKVLRWHFGEVL